MAESPPAGRPRRDPCRSRSKKAEKNDGNVPVMVPVTSPPFPFGDTRISPLVQDGKSGRAKGMFAPARAASTSSRSARQLKRLAMQNGENPFLLHVLRELDPDVCIALLKAFGQNAVTLHALWQYAADDLFKKEVDLFRCPPLDNRQVSRAVIALADQPGALNVIRESGDLVLVRIVLELLYRLGSVIYLRDIEEDFTAVRRAACHLIDAVVINMPRAGLSASHVYLFAHSVRALLHFNKLPRPASIRMQQLEYFLNPLSRLCYYSVAGGNRFHHADDFRSSHHNTGSGPGIKNQGPNSGGAMTPECFVPTLPLVRDKASARFRRLLSAELRRQYLKLQRPAAAVSREIEAKSRVFEIIARVTERLFGQSPCLFGSGASGLATAASDMDIVVLQTRKQMRLLARLARLWRELGEEDICPYPSQSRMRLHEGGRVTITQTQHHHHHHSYNHPNQHQHHNSHHKEATLSPTKGFPDPHSAPEPVVVEPMPATAASTDARGPFSGRTTLDKSCPVMEFSPGGIIQANIHGSPEDSLPSVTLNTTATTTAAAQSDGAMASLSGNCSVHLTDKRRVSTPCDGAPPLDVTNRYLSHRYIPSVGKWRWLEKTHREIAAIWSGRILGPRLARFGWLVECVETARVPILRVIAAVNRDGVPRPVPNDHHQRAVAPLGGGGGGGDGGDARFIKTRLDAFSPLDTLWNPEECHLDPVLAIGKDKNWKGHITSSKKLNQLTPAEKLQLNRAVQTEIDLLIEKDINCRTDLWTQASMDEEEVFCVATDISFNHEVVVHNTRLMKAYAEIQPSLAELGILIKHWAKQRGICDSYRGTLSGYQWMLMVIHFMQHYLIPSESYQGNNRQQLLPLLPNLQNPPASLTPHVSQIADGRYDVFFYHPLRGPNRVLSAPLEYPPRESDRHSARRAEKEQSVTSCPATATEQLRGLAASYWPEDMFQNKPYEYARYLLTPLYSETDWTSSHPRGKAATATPSRDEGNLLAMRQHSCPKWTPQTVPFHKGEIEPHQVLPSMTVSEELDHLILSNVVTGGDASLGSLLQEFFDYFGFRFNCYSHIVSIHRTPALPLEKCHYFSSASVYDAPLDSVSESFTKKPNFCIADTPTAFSGCSEQASQNGKIPTPAPFSKDGGNSGNIPARTEKSALGSTLEKAKESSQKPVVQDFLTAVASVLWPTTTSSSQEAPEPREDQLEDASQRTRETSASILRSPDLDTVGTGECGFVMEPQIVNAILTENVVLRDEASLDNPEEDIDGTAKIGVGSPALESTSPALIGCSLEPEASDACFLSNISSATSPDITSALSPVETPALSPCPFTVFPSPVLPHASTQALVSSTLDAGVRAVPLDEEGLPDELEEEEEEEPFHERLLEDDEDDEDLDDEDEEEEEEEDGHRSYKTDISDMSESDELDGENNDAAYLRLYYHMKKPDPLMFKGQSASAKRNAARRLLHQLEDSLCGTDTESEEEGDKRLGETSIYCSVLSESTTAADSLLPGCSSGDVSSTPHEEWRRRKLEKLEIQKFLHYARITASRTRQALRRRQFLCILDPFEKDRTIGPGRRDGFTQLVFELFRARSLLLEAEATFRKRGKIDMTAVVEELFAATSKLPQATGYSIPPDTRQSPYQHANFHNFATYDKKHSALLKRMNEHILSASREQIMSLSASGVALPLSPPQVGSALNAGNPARMGSGISGRMTKQPLGNVVVPPSRSITITQSRACVTAGVTEDSMPHSLPPVEVPKQPQPLKKTDYSSDSSGSFISSLFLVENGPCVSETRTRGNSTGVAAHYPLSHRAKGSFTADTTIVQIDTKQPSALADHPATPYHLPGTSARPVVSDADRLRGSAASSEPCGFLNNSTNALPDHAPFERAKSLTTKDRFFYLPRITFKEQHSLDRGSQACSYAKNLIISPIPEDVVASSTFQKTVNSRYSRSELLRHGIIVQSCLQARSAESLFKTQSSPQKREKNRKKKIEMQLVPKTVDKVAMTATPRKTPQIRAVPKSQSTQDVLSNPIMSAISPSRVDVFDYPVDCHEVEMEGPEERRFRVPSHLNKPKEIPFASGTTMGMPAAEKVGKMQVSKSAVLKGRHSRVIHLEKTLAPNSSRGEQKRGIELGVTSQDTSSKHLPPLKLLKKNQHSPPSLNKNPPMQQEQQLQRKKKHQKELEQQLLINSVTNPLNTVGSVSHHHSSRLESGTHTRTSKPVGSNTVTKAAPLFSTTNGFFNSLHSSSNNAPICLPSSAPQAAEAGAQWIQQLIKGHAAQTTDFNHLEGACASHNGIFAPSDMLRMKPVCLEAHSPSARGSRCVIPAIFKAESPKPAKSRRDAKKRNTHNHQQYGQQPHPSNLDHVVEDAHTSRRMPASIEDSMGELGSPHSSLPSDVTQSHRFERRSAPVTINRDEDVQPNDKQMFFASGYHQKRSKKTKPLHLTGGKPARCVRENGG